MKVIREHVLWKSLKREFLVGLSSYGKDAEMYAGEFTAAAAVGRTAAGAVKAALNIIEHSDNTEEQKIKLLKNLRFCLLDDIHFKQQLLDNVDYSIYHLRHNYCEEE